MKPNWRWGVKNPYLKFSGDVEKAAGVIFASEGNVEKLQKALRTEKDPGKVKERNTVIKYSKQQIRKVSRAIGQEERKIKKLQRDVEKRQIELEQVKAELKAVSAAKG